VLPICNVNLNVPKPTDRALPPESNKTLGAELKRKRMESQLSQREAAERLSVSLITYRGYESNKNIPHDHIKNRVNQFIGYNFWDDGSETLANKLLRYRIKKEMTAAELGTVIGVSRNTIKRIETEIYVSDKMKKIISGFLK